MTVSPTDSDAEGRWEAAAKLAAGVPDDGLGRRRARVFAWVAALIVGSWILGFILALALPDADSRGTGAAGGTTDSQLVAQLVFLAAGFAVGVAGFVWAVRTGHYITRWRTVISPLTWSEKKSVRRQIRSKEPVDTGHLTTIVAIAEQSRRATLGIGPLYAAMMLFAIATAIGTDEVLIKLLELAISVLFVVAAIQLAILYQRAGSFVERHRPDANRASR